MFNIQIGSNNSEQVPMGRFKLITGSRDLSTMYGAIVDIPKLVAFLMDVREMPQEEFDEVIMDMRERGNCMILHKWNTGKNYSKHGQRIAAKIENGSVLFADIDRHIYGVFVADGKVKDAYSLKLEVTRAYSSGYYSKVAYRDVEDLSDLAETVPSI